MTEARGQVGRRVAVTETGNSEVVSFASPPGKDLLGKTERRRNQTGERRGRSAFGDKERKKERDRERGGGRESNLVSSPENMGLFKRLGGIGE